MKYRDVAQNVSAKEALEGAGVRIRRTIGTPELDHLDPFLLLDECESAEGADYIASFPDHPHRGFETVTYMLAGLMRHEDHKGNRGELGPGSGRRSRLARTAVAAPPERLPGPGWSPRPR